MGCWRHPWVGDGDVRLKTAPTGCCIRGMGCVVENRLDIKWWWILSIRRYYVPNAIVFITQVVDRRTPIFQHEAHLSLLRATLHNVKELHPFNMLGYVFLPDHFHLLIRPTGQSNFSKIMHSLKQNFTKSYKGSLGISGSMKFWQKGFWDHVIRDEVDLARHLDYIHYNPVRHQLVTRPEDWPHSSYLYWQQQNAYAERWGWSLPEALVDYVWQPAMEEPNEPTSICIK